MQNKVFVSILVIAIGVSLGIIVMSKKDASQQEEMHRILKAIEQGMGQPKGQEQTATLIALQDLQKRVGALEDKINSGAFAAPSRPPQPPQEDYAKVHDIPVDHSPVRGPKNAPVTITEFVDFQCPFCARFHSPILEVLEAYPDKVNFVLKNFPLSFHPEGVPAAKAAFAAGEQGKYWEMVDLILKDNSNLGEARYQELAKQLGLNMDKFNKDMQDTKWDSMIEADMTLGSKVDVRGTPTFYINGRKTTARDLNGWKREIENILSNQ